MACILIVEDEAVTAMDLEWLMEDLGHRVIGPYSSGENALLEAETNPPDLALVDINLLGKLDGLAVVRRLRERFNVPSLVISGHAVDRFGQDAGSEAPVGLIRKPFNDAHVKAAVQAALAQLGLNGVPGG